MQRASIHQGQTEPADKKKEHDRQNAETSPSTLLKRTKSIRLKKTKRISLTVNDKTESQAMKIGKRPAKHMETSRPFDEKSRDEAPPVNQSNKGLVAYISELEAARLQDEHELNKLKGQIKLLLLVADENAALKLKVAALEEEVLSNNEKKRDS